MELEMQQPGARHGGIFGRGNPPLPFQTLNERSYADGSLGATFIPSKVRYAPARGAAYQDGSLGAIELSTTTKVVLGFFVGTCFGIVLGVKAIGGSFR